MAFDEQLADRVRKALGRRAGLVEKKMFGGLAFLLNGNMSVGVHGNELIVRVAPDESAALLNEPGARVFDITGRPMKGWLLVGGAGITDADSLAKWVRRGAAHAATLPSK
jgi:TfoX/Sxy family transcriptional regulator of competence genes